MALRSWLCQVAFGSSSNSPQKLNNQRRGGAFRPPSNCTTAKRGSHSPQNPAEFDQLAVTPGLSSATASSATGCGPPPHVTAMPDQLHLRGFISDFIPAIRFAASIVLGALPCQGYATPRQGQNLEPQSNRYTAGARPKLLGGGKCANVIRLRWRKNPSQSARTRAVVADCAIAGLTPRHLKQRNRAWPAPASLRLRRLPANFHQRRRRYDRNGLEREILEPR